MERDPCIADYPTIPQLWGSNGTADDTFMARRESLDALRRCTIALEKRDGWNVGVAPGRKSPLLKGRPVDWKQIPGPDHLVTKLRDFMNRTAWDEPVFGEWCPDDSSNDLPWFPFDVFDSKTGRFATWNRVLETAASCELTTPRTLHRGAIMGIDQVRTLASLQTTRGDQIEGVVIRIESDRYLLERFKFVRAGFVKRGLHD